MLLVTSAAAAATAISMDGKVYSFFGDVTGKTYAIEGKTFIFLDDTVCVRQDGKEDVLMALGTTSYDTVAVENVSTAYTSGAVSETAEADSVVIPVENQAAVCACATYIDYNDNFAQYAKFGLSYDTAEDTLYYNGQRVRIFEDAYPQGPDVSVSVEHIDPNGIVDIEAVHNQAGTQPTGLTALSGMEFDARDLTKWTQPAVKPYMAYAASSGTPMTEEEAKAFYAPYEEYGLTYDYQIDSLRLNGKIVREFIDIQKSNGKSLTSGYFSGTITSHYSELGTIDVRTVRDYTRPDAQGYGTLIGIEVDPVE